MTRVSILHASDLHIAEAEYLISPADELTPGNLRYAVRKWAWASSWDSAVFKAFADLTLELAEDGEIDGVILTGDIATTGAIGDLGRAHDVLYGPWDGVEKSMGRNRLPTLGALGESGVPLLILPGNHDGYAKRIRRKRPWYSVGDDTFDSAFGVEWTGPVMKYAPIVGEDVVVQVIGVDCRLRSRKDKEGHAMFSAMGQGRVYDDTLRLLEEITSDVRREHTGWRKLVLVWAVHFPPCYPGGGIKLKLVDGEKLVAAAHRLGVAAVLSGHTHEQVKYNHPDMGCDVYCCGTTAQHWAPEGNYCQLISFDAGPGGSVEITLEVFRYDASTGGAAGFVPMESRAVSLVHRQ